MKPRMKPIDYPRPVEVTSHQFFARGLAMALVDGRMLVELEDGRTQTFDVTTVYSFKFTDRERGSNA